MASSEPHETTYFGYGSNLWKQQMKQRCPTSEFLGIARLNGYQWIINDRGYANVVEVSDTKKAKDCEAWGLVFRLQPSDEDRLDLNEGVPESYTKEDISTGFWPTGKDWTIDKAEKKDMLVYIDRKRTEADVPKKEYIYRMNMGIKDALKEGVPKKYVDGVLRDFIPDVEDENVSSFARQQARFFEDED